MEEHNGSKPLTCVNAIAVQGYKSLSQSQQIEISPLTILAGVNSSGKSSLMQPVLLLKQTLEAMYDPGTVLLDGPHLKITSREQIFSKKRQGGSQSEFSIQFELIDNPGFESNDQRVGLTFERAAEKGLAVKNMSCQNQLGTFTMSPGMTHEEILNIVPASIRGMHEALWMNWMRMNTMQPDLKRDDIRWMITQDRCFLNFATYTEQSDRHISLSPVNLTDEVKTHLRNLIHLSGLRGNPERTYKTAAVGEQFPGDFREYVASMLYHWQRTQPESLRQVGQALQELGLTWTVEATPIDDTQVELRVGRFHAPEGENDQDLVSIADVGFGVSQVLPVIVALQAAKPGQIVYVEQPEIHLHPNAQHKMASLLVDAAKRGVRVIIETHSSILLLGIQTLVASGKMPYKQVKLHWFSRTPEGTRIDSTELDETGAFGEWPLDFDDVILRANSEYLNAVEEKESRQI